MFSDYLKDQPQQSDVDQDNPTKKYARPKGPFVNGGFAPAAVRDAGTATASAPTSIGTTPTSTPNPADIMKMDWKDWAALLGMAVGAGLNTPGFYGPSGGEGIGKAIQTLGAGYEQQRGQQRELQMAALQRQNSLKVYEQLANDPSLSPEQRAYYRQYAIANSMGPTAGAVAVPKPVDPLKHQQLQASIDASGARKTAAEAQARKANLEANNLEQGKPMHPAAAPRAKDPADRAASNTRLMDAADIQLGRDYTNATKGLHAFTGSFSDWMKTGEGQRALQARAATLPENLQKRYTDAKMQSLEKPTIDSPKLKPFVEAVDKFVKEHPNETLAPEELQAALVEQGITEADARDIIEQLKERYAPKQEETSWTDTLRNLFGAGAGPTPGPVPTPTPGRP